jgi:mRNA interferase RelE/StbE
MISWRSSTNAFKRKINLSPWMKFDADTRDRIKLALRNLENDPFRNRPKADIKKLEGTKGRESLYRLRIGDYRAVYAVEGEYSMGNRDIFERQRLSKDMKVTLTTYFSFRRNHP